MLTPGLAVRNDPIRSLYEEIRRRSMGLIYERSRSAGAAALRPNRSQEAQSPHMFVFSAFAL